MRSLLKIVLCEKVNIPTKTTFLWSFWTNRFIVHILVNIYKHSGIKHVFWRSFCKNWFCSKIGPKNISIFQGKARLFRIFGENRFCPKSFFYFHTHYKTSKFRMRKYEHFEWKEGFSRTLWKNRFQQHHRKYPNLRIRYFF